MGAEEPIDEGALESSTDKEATLRRVRFRHYVPTDESLRIYCEDGYDARRALRAVEEQQDAALAQAATQFASPSLDLENMIPKKSNWDLKRIVAPKLEKLERRTQRAIYDLVRSSAGPGMDVSTGSNAGQRLARTVADVRFLDSDDDRGE